MVVGVDNVVSRATNLLFETTIIVVHSITVVVQSVMVVMLGTNLGVQDVRVTT